MKLTPGESSWSEIIIWNLDHRLVHEDKLAHLDVSGGHQPPALPLDLGDHHGEAVPLVPLEVGHLALLAAIGDGVTTSALEELLLSWRSLLTFKADLTVSQRLNVGLWHLC